jgi:hypothetical protein
MRCCLCLSPIPAACQRLGKHVLAATNTQSILELSDAVFSMQYVSYHILKICRSPRRNKNMVLGPDGIRNQDWLRWRGPPAIYPTDRFVLPRTSCIIMERLYFLTKWPVGLKLRTNDLLMCTPKWSTPFFSCYTSSHSLLLAEIKNMVAL